MTRTSGPGRRRALFALILALLLGLCSGSVALFALTQSVNVVAYWLGYGDTMRVEVTKGSVGSSFGRDSDPGEGRVVGDGRTVRLYGVHPGETITARPRLINIGAEPYAYHSALGAAEDLVWLIPSAIFGVPSAIFILGVFAPQRLTQWATKHSRKPGGSPPLTQ